MSTDMDSLLSQANPVREIEEYGPDQQGAILERITSSRPHPLRSRRRPVILAAALTGLTAVVLIATSTTKPESALAGVELERDGSGYRVIITDVERDARELTEALHSYGFDITLALRPVSPSLVGSIVGGSAEGRTEWIDPLHDGPCRATANCEVGFRIPANWQGEATILLGRPAQPGERYLVAASAFDKGEFLGCSFRPGMRVSELLPELARRGITVHERPEGPTDPNARIGPDGIVTDVATDSASSAFLFAAPTAAGNFGPGLNCAGFTP